MFIKRLVEQLDPPPYLPAYAVIVCNILYALPLVSHFNGHEGPFRCRKQVRLTDRSTFRMHPNTEGFLIDVDLSFILTSMNSSLFDLLKGGAQNNQTQLLTPPDLRCSFSA